VNIAGEAIQFGNDKSGAVQSAEPECFGDGGPSDRKSFIFTKLITKK
jgi:hypothetical protein